MKAVLLFIFLGSLVMNPISAHAETTKNKTSRPTEGFRNEHVEMKRHLQQVENWAGTLSSATPAEQKKTMAKVISFFQKELEPHAQWEEKKLYPAVDKRASEGTNAFTSSMRHEHKIVGRWIEELQKEASSPKPDPIRFTRKTDQLLGLVIAHFESEEEVLLPILDKSMTPAEFKNEILSDTKH